MPTPSSVPVHGGRERRHRAKRRPAPLLLAAGAALLLAGYTVGYSRTATARQVLTSRPTHRELYHDGAYSAWGHSPHGRILATVVIKRGRIVSTAITDCRMRYPCSMIAALPAQSVERQGADVDLVSGATQSAEAFSMAVDGALAQAARR